MISQNLVDRHLVEQYFCKISTHRETQEFWWNAGLGWGHYCGLNIRVPLKFTCGNPNLQCATSVQMWGGLCRDLSLPPGAECFPHTQPHAAPKLKAMWCSSLRGNHGAWAPSWQLMSMFTRRNLPTLFKKSGCGSHTHTQNMHAYVCIHPPGCYTYKKCPHPLPKCVIWITVIRSYIISSQKSSGNHCCCCSVTQSCPNLCDQTDYSMPGFPVLHHLPEFAQTHVHWVSDAIQPSHPLLPPFPLAFNLFQPHSLFQWVFSSHQMTKVMELQLQHQSFQWIFRDDFL